MKYCTHCGHEVNDEAEICVNCGCRVKQKSNSNTGNTLGTVAKVFMIITCASYALVGLMFLIIGFPLMIGAISAPPVDSVGGVIFGVGFFVIFIYAIIFLIPLAWCIPMTVSVCRKLKNGEPISTALKVCTMLFVSLIAGIMLLCMGDNQ